jgi:IgGFc binding protein
MQRLLVIAALTSGLVACRERTVQKLVDGGIQCAEEERVVNGECVFICDRDSDCPAGQRCNLFTGACEARPPEPDAGPNRTPCTTGATRCTADSKAVETCSVDGAWNTTLTCTPPAGFCLNEVCLACQPGTARCSGTTTLEICRDDGSGFRQVTCAAGATCNTNECRECPPNATRCNAANDAQQTCTRTADETNSWKWVNSGDAFDGTCVTRVCELNTMNQSVCRAPQCIPGATQCKNASTQQVCSPTGTFTDVVCSTLPGMGPNAECANGTCFDECADAVRAKSYFGCEYWTAVQDNSVDTLFKGGTTSGMGNSDSDFAFVVTNRSTQPANVEVWRHTGAAPVRVKTVVVPGRLDASTKGLMTINVPWQSIGTAAALDTESTTGRARYGYRLVSSRPITAYQFNPLPAVKYTKTCTGAAGNVDCSCDESGNFNALNCLLFGSSGGVCANAPGGGKKCSYNSYTNDASLLLPAHILGTSHVVVTPHTLGMAQNSNQAPVRTINGHVTIVGTQDATQVTVRSSANTIAGGGITAMVKAGQQTFTLNSYDVLQLASTHLNNAYIQCTTSPFTNIAPQVCRIDNDLTGTIVTSDKPVAVFGGSSCSLMPYNRAACDHLEEQIFPFATWGKNFVAVRSHPLRLNNNAFATNSPPDYYKVVASCPASQCAQGTRITINPAPAAANVLLPNRCTTGSLATNDCQLAGGQFMEFAATANMHISADQPIAVAQFFPGQGPAGFLPTDPAQGDPSMVLLPPSEQWRANYTVLAAPGIRDNYLALAIDTTKVASVDVDGMVVTGFTAIAGTNFQVKNHPVGVGTHTITVTPRTGMVPGAGVTVYGYDSYVSYGYTGGLDLGTIVTGINPGG